jgi:hypothetical protein
MSDIVLEQCDPRDREHEIKELFSRNQRPAFADVFDRAYRARADQGLSSWIGRVDGRAVMHISVTPVRFSGGAPALTAGVLGDLMVDESHRDFWAPVRLLRQMISDLKRGRRVDFLVTTTVAEAETIFKAGGFKAFGTMRRYVMPLYRPYLWVARMRGGVRRYTAQAADFKQCDALSRATGRGRYWRPEPDTSYYGTRIPRLEFLDERWVGVTDRSGAHAGCALLSRSGLLPELGLADAFCREGVHLAEVVQAASKWALRERVTKLVLTTLQESHATKELERAGFLARDVRSALLIHQLGSTAPPPVDDWFLPGFALTGW